MKSIRELHKKAMDLAEMAFVAKLRGNLEKADQLSQQAFEYEAQAARLTPDEPSSEPTRSVLYSSAASLALDCNEFREAERLIAAGLAGYPPEEIAEELRELFERVNCQLHLSSDDSQLDEDSDAEGNRATITGRLLYANSINSEKKTIGLVDENGESHNIIVPEGMMKDIVSPLWEKTVTVTASYNGREVQLENIRRVSVA